MEGNEEGGRAGEAFAALANEHRMRIIETLWDGRSTGPHGPASPVSFSTLFEASDLEDKGQFNYHLGKLVGPFLARGDDGYTLTYAGENVARAVRAGSVTDNPEVESVPVEGRSCPFCGDDGIVMSYRGGVVLFSCTNCEGLAPESPMSPPGAIQAGTIPASALVDRDPAELYDDAILWGNHVYMTLLHGFCPVCAGAIDEALAVCDDHDASDGLCEACGERFASRVRYECRVCGTVEWGTLWGRLTYVEPVFGFLYNHGVNALRPSVDDLALSRDLSEDVVSDEPPAVEYEFVVDGDAFRVRVESDLAVTAVDADQSPRSAENSIESGE
ncbi:MAG: hypothetical protein ABEJ89_04165 [Haloarculaceae archaeon]